MISNKWFFGLNDKDAINESLSIRKAVFETEQGKGNEILDVIDDSAYHLNVYVDDSPAATGRLYFSEGDYYIGKIAVLNNFRGKKIGDFTMRLLLAKALNQGAFTIKVNADINAVGFYSKYGFTKAGEALNINGHEHWPMALDRENIKFCSSCSKNCKGTI